jgi:hypothetical protein
MFKQLLHLFMQSTLVTLGVGATMSASLAQPIPVGNTLPNDPLVVQGQTGGTVSSNNCGFIDNAPSQVLEISQRIDYMRIQVEASGGQPTLLVDGPDGKFCVLASNLAQNYPEISGVWLPGLYKIYVGDRAGNQHDFTLSISQQR